MQLFWRQGYEATSISDLTEALGIRPPSLYAAFGDKERLFLEAVERYQCGAGNSARILAESATARAAIEALLWGSAHEMTRKSHPPGCMIVTSTLVVSDGSVHLQRSLKQRRIASEARIRARIERGIEVGELPAGTHAAALAKYYMTVMQGMTVQARDGATREALEATAALAMRAWPGA